MLRDDTDAGALPLRGAPVFLCYAACFSLLVISLIISVIWQKCREGCKNNSKKVAEKFASSKKVRNFAHVKRTTQRQRLLKEVFGYEKLSCGVMVARRILVPPVGVRIPPRQLFRS